MNIGDPASDDRLPEIGADQFRGEGARVVRPYLRTSTVGPMAKMPPPALSAALNMRGLLRGIYRNLGVALGLGLLLATAAAVATWFGVPNAKYTARSMLRVSSVPTKIVFITSDRAPGTQPEFKMFQNTQEQLIKSRFVLGKALSHPSVAKLPSVVGRLDPVEWLADELTITFIGEVLYIGLATDNPDEVVKLVNAVTDAYMDEVVNDDNKRRKTRLADLEAISTKYKDDMKARKENLAVLAKRAGSNDKGTVQYKIQLAMERNNYAKQDLRSLQTQLRQARLDLAVLEATPQAPPPTKAQIPDDSAAKIKSAVQAALDQDPTILQYSSRIDDLEGKLKGLRRLVRSENDPAIRLPREELKTLKDRLRTVHEQRRQRLTTQYTDQYVHGVAEPLIAAPQGTGRERNLLAKRIEVLAADEKELIAEVEKLEAGLQSNNDMALSLETTKDEIQPVERNAELINQEIENLKVELYAPSRVVPLEAATVPRAASEKKRLVATGFAGVAIFALVLLSVAWLDARVRRIDKVDEVVHGLGMELVGTLPPLSVRSRRALTSSAAERDRNETGILMEAVDSTRAMLMHVLRNESIRTVMVASAQKGEGKTSLSCHLATSLARARQRTLLIDCDLRCPTIHMLFDLPLGPGVCDILRGDADVADIIQPTSAPLLSLLTAGQCDSSAIEALAHGSLQRLFDAVQGQFDYIIVDSAPVLAVADSLQVCQHVDAVLFSVLRDVSRLPRIHAAYEQLSRLGVRMLGVVVAGTQIEDHGYSYSYQGRTMDASHEGAAVASGKDHR